VNSVKELVALAKKRPGQLNFTSSGAGSSTHLTGELLKQRHSAILRAARTRDGAQTEYQHGENAVFHAGKHTRAS